MLNYNKNELFFQRALWYILKSKVDLSMLSNNKVISNLNLSFLLLL
jgi:hypothetical protein